MRPKFIVSTNISRFLSQEERTFPIWELFSLNDSIQNLVSIQTKYNEKVGRKWKFRSGELETAKILLYLALKELDKLRLINPKAYRLIISPQNKDGFAVTTNRGQIRTMLHGAVGSLSTISRYLSVLMEAGIILKKQNMSRTTEKVVNIDGSIRTIHRPALDGRGDFRLFISKKVFAHIYQVNEVETGNDENSKNAEDESITKENKENSSQPFRTFIETSKINYNNCGTVENGAASRREDSVTPQAATKKHRNDGIIYHFKGKEPSEQEEISAAGRRYLDIHAKDWRIRSKMPNESIQFYAAVLSYQAFRLIYPDYTQEYCSFISPQVFTLFETHLRRLNKRPSEGFQDISRAIYLGHRYQENHGFTFPHILTWLQLDDEGARLKRIIDVWLPNEEKRLQLLANRNSRLVKWQQVTFKAEELFLNVVYTLRIKGFSSSKKVFVEARNRLDNYFKKFETDENLQKKILEGFTKRCLSTFTEIENLDKQESLANDTVFRQFELWRKNYANA